MLVVIAIIAILLQCYSPLLGKPVNRQFPVFL
ncbi:MAG: hypothetical protein MK132_00485 [Lentisphaerales bacterium]|nr:hypothetical protein [Lentisphaerales bacterium]